MVEGVTYLGEGLWGCEVEKQLPFTLPLSVAQQYPLLKFSVPKDLDLNCSFHTTLIWYSKFSVSEAKQLPKSSKGGLLWAKNQFLEEVFLFQKKKKKKKSVQQVPEFGPVPFYKPPFSNSSVTPPCNPFENQETLSLSPDFWDLAFL